MLMGGRQDGYDRAFTWFLNTETEEWTPGPNMIEKRRRFGCGLIKEINAVAVFGGSYNEGSAEILKTPAGQFEYSDFNCRPI